MTYKLKRIALFYEDAADNKYYLETAEVIDNVIKVFAPPTPGTISDLQESFSKMPIEENKKYLSIRGEIIPDGVIFHNAKNSIVWKHSKCKKIILYKDAEIEVTFSPLLFKYKSGKLFIYCYTDRLTSSSKLYRLLLPNIYSDTNALCLGNMSLDFDDDSLSVIIEKCENVFFNSKFSDHLYDKSIFEFENCDLYMESIKNASVKIYKNSFISLINILS